MDDSQKLEFVLINLFSVVYYRTTLYLCALFQCGALLDDSQKLEFAEEIQEEYEDIREDHYDSLKVLN